MRNKAKLVCVTSYQDVCSSFLLPHSYFLIFLLLAALLLAMAGCSSDPFYIEVAFIEGVPETGEARTPLTLTGTVRPSFASNKDIVWSVKDAGTTRASISGNILNTLSTGTVTIRAIIANGMAEGKEFTQDFIIDIKGEPWIELITNVNLIITGPMKGETPDTTAVAESGENYTPGLVSWSPEDNPFLGLTAYTATVTVTANTGSKFTETLTAEMNGHTAVITDRTDTAVTISHTFDPTPAKAITNTAIYSQPVKTTYTHGDTLDLTGLSVELTYDDYTSEIVILENFSDLLSENPANGSTLSHTTHNKQPVKVSIGRHDAYTDILTVNKAIPAITFPTAAPLTYGIMLSQSELTGGSSTPPGTFAWQNSADIPTVTNSGYPVEFTPTDTDNYDFTGISGWNSKEVVQLVAISVSKAAGAAVAAPVITWNAAAHRIEVTAVTPPGNGQQTVEYNISITSNGSGLGTWQTELTFDISTVGTYYVYARSAESANYNAGAESVSAGLTVVNQNIGFEIKPGDSPVVTTGVVISKSGANGPTKAILTVSAGYTEVTWYYNDIELGTGANLTLDALDYRYNMIGAKFVRVEAWKGGVPYSANVGFEVIP